MITLRHATLKDIEAFFGRKPDRTVKAMIVEKDGELACIAGVIIGRNYTEAFSDMKPVNVPKITIWRYAKKLKDYIESLGLPVIALSKNNSGRFLESLGFTYVGTYYNEKVYRL